MNKQQFLAKLREALAGLSASEIDDIVSDYDAHFTEAAAAGRSEADVAAALGEPARLAKELKAESGLKRLEAKPTPTNFIVAIGAFLGLATFNIIFVLPILIATAALLFGWAVASFALLGAGFGVLFHGIFREAGIDAVAQMLAGAGLVCGAVGGGAFWLLTVGWLAKLFVAYARLHLKVMKPALEAE
jgi:uncharacterized membrane protein